MNSNKFLASFLALLILILTIVSCGKDDVPANSMNNTDNVTHRNDVTSNDDQPMDEKENSHDDQSSNTSENSDGDHFTDENENQDGDLSTDEDERESSNKDQSSDANEKEADVYNRYDNLVRIGDYNNGLAPFLIYCSSSNFHWQYGIGSWSGDYFYGYIDTMGNVVIEPTYGCNPYADPPSFEYNYIKVSDSNDNESIIDKKGNIQFAVGKNDVTAIGKVSEGYFWVETVEEYISGNEYTVRYYSANDLSIVVTFEGIRAIPDNMTIGGVNSTLTASGEGTLAYDLNKYSWYDGDLAVFSIGEYDSSYSPKQDNWNVDLKQVENFSSAAYYYYHVSGENNDRGQLATVALKNSDGVWFYSVVDNNGNVLMQPQKGITFPLENNKIDDYDFCKNLCPAKDEESGYWGYIDPQGNWIIQPQYSSVTAFSVDGYATVNDKIVINTEGMVILSPAGWTNEIVTSLSGTYKLSTGNSGSTWSLTFSEDGKLKIKESMYGGSISKTGDYQIKGSTLVISNIGYNIGCPIYSDGNYTFRKEGDTLIIGDSEWILTNVS